MYRKQHPSPPSAEQVPPAPDMSQRISSPRFMLIEMVFRLPGWALIAALVGLAVFSILRRQL